MDNSSTASRAQLRADLDWVLGRVRRFLSRFGRRLTQAQGGIDDLYVSLDEARAILGGQTPPDFGAALGLPDRAAPDAPPGLSDGPLAHIAGTFGLDPLEARALLAAAAPALSIDVARLYGFAWADFTIKQPSVGFLAELLTDDPDEAVALVARFAPDAPLVERRLVHLTAPEQWGPYSPVLHRGVTVPEPLLAVLRGEAADRPRRIGSAIRFARAAAPAQPIVLDEAHHRRVSTALGVGAPRVVLLGAPGAGRRGLVDEHFAAQGRVIAEIALDALPGDLPLVQAQLGEVTRDARLAGAALFLRCDRLDPSEPAPLEAAARLVADYPGPVIIAATKSPGTLHRHLDRVVEIELPLPDNQTQATLWKAAFEQADATVDDALCTRLAERFQATPGAIASAARAAAEGARLEGPDHPIDAARVALAFRQRIDHALGEIAESVSTTLDWSDVILPDDVIATLHEIRSQARHRTRVFDEWGFRRKMAYGRGLACLFSGPPGTGKTMMAGILARDLGRELYRVDLSRVVSKWVGETEKNLSRIFDEAERAQVILFFDEADSLFAGRTEVKGANDRFANMEVNYLLQRMEQFDGMTILTTNFERGIDEAFKRRLRFRVHFPMPDTPERTRLWESMIPPQMPTAAGIRFELLGKKFKLSGGNIKNAVLRAAFYAADGEGELTEKLLRKAAEAEAREMGRL